MLSWKCLGKLESWGRHSDVLPLRVPKSQILVFGKFHSDETLEQVGYPDVDLGVVDLGQAHSIVIETLGQ